MTLGSGMDVDIVTGRPPLSHTNNTAKDREEKRQVRAINRYQDLVNDLSGNGGETIKQVAGLFADRINQLIKEDPSCLAYQAIFDGVGIKINIGKRIVQEKMERVEELIS